MRKCEHSSKLLVSGVCQCQEEEANGTASSALADQTNTEVTGAAIINCNRSTIVTIGLGCGRTGRDVEMN